MIMGSLGQVGRVGIFEKLQGVDIDRFSYRFFIKRGQM